MKIELRIPCLTDTRTENVRIEMELPAVPHADDMVQTTEGGSSEIVRYVSWNEGDPPTVVCHATDLRHVPDGGEYLQALRARATR